MHRLISRVSSSHLLLAAAIALVAGSFAPANAAPIHYRAALNGASESPANASPGVGNVEVTVDPVANTMQIAASFSGLLGTTSACHIHAPTAVALTGTAGVATTTPAFAGFPLGVTSGSYNNTLDMTQSTSYNASFITAHGGTTAGAEAFLFQAIADGKAYFNLHSSIVPGGEIRGFLQPFDPTPTANSTWARVKSLYH